MNDVFKTDRKGNYINERTNEWMMSSKQIEKVTTQTNEWMMSSKQLENVTT